MEQKANFKIGKIYHLGVLFELFSYITQDKAFQRLYQVSRASRKLLKQRFLALKCLIPEKNNRLLEIDMSHSDYKRILRNLLTKHQFKSKKLNLTVYYIDQFRKEFENHYSLLKKFKIHKLTLQRHLYLNYLDIMQWDQFCQICNIFRIQELEFSDLILTKPDINEMKTFSFEKFNSLIKVGINSIMSDLSLLKDKIKLQISRNIQEISFGTVNYDGNLNQIFLSNPQYYQDLQTITIKEIIIDQKGIKSLIREDIDQILNCLPNVQLIFE